LTGNEVTTAARIAVTAVPAVPADPDPLALRPSGNPFADRIYDSGDFMSRHPRVLDTRPQSLPGHGITVADAARFDLYANLPGARIRNIAFNKFKWATSLSDLHDTHLCHKVSPFAFSPLTDRARI
jgi:hypothetical protein